MKIIETAKDIANKKEARDIANMGCNRCPCCGETNSDLCMCENSSHFFTDVSYNETCEYWEPNWDYLPNRLEYLADVEVDEMEKS